MWCTGLLHSRILALESVMLQLRWSCGMRLCSFSAQLVWAMSGLTRPSPYSSLCHRLAPRPPQVSSKLSSSFLLIRVLCIRAHVMLLCTLACAYTHACITHDSKKSGSTPQRIQNTQTRIQHEIFICFMLLDCRKEINPEQPSKFKRFFFGRKSGTQGLRNAENVQTLKLINQASTIWEVWDHLIFGVFCSSCAFKVESHAGASCKMLYTTAVSNTS